MTFTDKGRRVRDKLSEREKKVFQSLTEEERLIIEALEGSLSIEEISSRCHIPVSKVTEMIHALEEKGAIKPSQ